jgi:hypothetical protein
MKQQIFYKKTKQGHLFWNEASKKCDYSHETFSSFKPESMLGILALADTSLTYYGGILPDWVERYLDKFEGPQESFPYHESDEDYDDFPIQEDDDDNNREDD